MIFHLTQVSCAIVDVATDVVCGVVKQACCNVRYRYVIVSRA